MVDQKPPIEGPRQIGVETSFAGFAVLQSLPCLRTKTSYERQISGKVLVTTGRRLLHRRRGGSIDRFGVSGP